jgi:uncharacterized membrane protein YiaA
MNKQILMYSLENSTNLLCMTAVLLALVFMGWWVAAVASEEKTKIPKIAFFITVLVFVLSGLGYSYLNSHNNVVYGKEIPKFFKK